MFTLKSTFLPLKYVLCFLFLFLHEIYNKVSRLPIGKAIEVK